jgi:hypothetical protein
MGNWSDNGIRAVFEEKSPYLLRYLELNGI